MKTCKKCGEPKPLTEFYANSRMRDGRLNACRACATADTRAYKERHADQHKARMKAYHHANRDRLLEQQRAYREENRERLAAQRRAANTGFTPALWEQVLEHQQHRCAVCRIDLRALKRTQVHADHCHQTGNPRGILCQRCNTSIGQFNDDPTLLRRAAAYLEAPPTLEVLL